MYMIIRSFAGMAELADAPDLGSGGRPCRFKSCYPHDFRVFETFEMFQRSCFFAFDSNGKNKEFKNFFASQTETTFIPGIFSGLQIPCQLSARSSTVLFLPVFKYAFLCCFSIYNQKHFSIWRQGNGSRCFRSHII